MKERTRLCREGDPFAFFGRLGPYRMCERHFFLTRSGSRIRTLVEVIARKSTQTQPKIIAWLKPSCGWSNGVRAVLRKYGLQYEDRDIINHPEYYEEMVRLTGQPYQPCVQVGEAILADISGEELEAWADRKRGCRADRGGNGRSN
ncbi:MAG: hypothetical protein KatS3mg115_1989 [Candidatus Poribacteria bacterium]|nr:MAG: hypothetical protein KatS3mg115_1989 [Candidatus Poribacteria bacterium]